MSVPLRPFAWGPTPGRDRDGAESAYRESPAPPTLAAVAVCTWSGEPGWSRSLRVLPDGCADLVWDGTALRMVLPAAGPVRLALDADATPSGIRLRPGVAGHVAGRPVDDVPLLTDLGELWGDSAAGYASVQRAEARLRSAVDPAGRRDALVRLAVERLAAVGPPDPRLLAAVGHLSRPAAEPRGAAAHAGLSPRHLRRRLREQAGLGATDLHRVFRFQRFLRVIDAHAHGGQTRPALAVLAAVSGFADQAHLTRECRRLSGSTPRSLVRGRLARPPGPAHTYRPAAPPD